MIKWLGEHIWDFISRFRNDVYFHQKSTPTEYAKIQTGPKGEFVLTTENSDGAAAHVEIAADGDITLDAEGQIKLEPVAGNNILLDGTVTVDGGSVTGLTTLGLDSVSLTAVQTSAESFADNDTSLMTSAAIDDRINAAAGGGDITGVSAGTNLTGGGTTGDVTINLADASTSAKGAVELATTAETTTGTDTSRAVTPDGLKDGFQGSTNITTLGTVGTGTWNASIIATAKLKHLAYFEFKGYSTADGTNFEMPEYLSDNNAPFELNTSQGEEGVAATSYQKAMRTGGTIMPRGGIMTKWIGWAASAGSGEVTIGLYKIPLVRNDSGNTTPVATGAVTAFTALGNAKLEDFDVTELGEDNASFSAGDMIVAMVKGTTSGKIVYFSTTLEVEWT